ncbi:cullin-1, putative [Entamoeba invadens IP1]|uniref:cullin-1, putative n=1 Tax=Entamoeba invadens IP1 TaxID=370355 RepID=UPI0002C3EF5A|nr:cullin-1, putative [Entamoeba invadens IP1]ELP93457.1 cullin-1, putative [Entamoeba invadens IP1]|eukprot:XP_004260228.1 cullin-1, putative [Entamoeba invadens IP1]
MQSLFPKNCTEEQYKEQQTTLFSKFQTMMDSEEVSESSEYMMLYNIVFSLCTSLDDTLKERLYYDIFNFITKQTMTAAEKLSKESDVGLLTDYTRLFKQFENGVNGIKKVCKYLTKFVIEMEIKQKRGKSRFRDVGDIGKIEWKRNVFDNLNKKLYEISSTLIQHARVSDERKSLEVVREYTKSLIVLHSVMDSDVIGLYVSSFEEPYLKQLTEETETWIASTFNELEIIEYIKEGFLKVSKEQNVIGNCLESITLEKIMSVMSDEMWMKKREQIKPHINKIFERCIKEDIALLYTTFSRCSNSREMLTDLNEGYAFWITKIMKEALDEYKPTKNTNYVGLIEMYIGCYLKIMDLLKVFEGSSAFMESVKNGVANFLNSPDNMYHEEHPKYIALYIDLLLRRVGPGKEALDVVLSKVDNSMNLLQSVENKDVFMVMNTNLVARRLLNTISGFDESVEKCVIEGIRSVCGCEYISKINHMNRDISSSVELDVLFHEKVKTPLYVNVLTLGVWPFSNETVPSEILPKDISAAEKEYEAFYLKKGKSKKLVWLNHLGKAMVLVRVGSFKVDLLIQTSAFCVMNLINQYGSDWEAKGHVQKAQVFSAYETLRRLGVIEESEGKVCIKREFFLSQKTRRIVINCSEQTEREKESDVEKELQNSRKVVMQSFIVRIMKQKKYISHNDLVADVFKISSSKFVPTISLIKDTVEYLIEKEYIRRSEQDPSCYEYVY